MSEDFNEFPDIEIEFSDKENPTLRSPNAIEELSFRSTEDTFMDVDVYKDFINNCISRFRHSKTYKNYKKYLYDIGLNKCQLLGNIDSEMADIQMHHNFLNIFDITLLITEHKLKTEGSVLSYDVVQELKEEHKNNEIPLVMLSKTAHQLYHNGDGITLPARMCFGYWYDLIHRFNRGITVNIAQKIIYFVQTSIDFERENGFIDSNCTNTLLEVRKHVLGWSEYNEYADNINITGVSYDDGDYCI